MDITQYSIEMNRPKTIVITGASTGIGYACADQFLKQGYKVWGSVRREADAKRLKEEFGDNFSPLLMDVTSSEEIQAGLSKVKKELEGETLGGLINNAGIAVDGPIQHLDIKEIKKQFDVNVIGLVEVIQQFLPLLGARPDHGSMPGRIINMSSVGGQLAAPFLAPYVGSKHAVEGISHSLRRELQIFGIDVIIIAPGAVVTSIWDKAADEKAFNDTAYYDSFRNFSEYFQKMGRSGLPADFVGNRIVSIIESENPKTYYSFVKGKMANLTIPKLLPDRTLDQMIGRQLGMLGNGQS